MNMKGTKETGICGGAVDDDSQKRKDNVVANRVRDISNQNDEGLESKDDPLKINQSSSSSPPKSNSLSTFPANTNSSSNLFAKSNVIYNNVSSMPATSINPR